jgi:hypothetical protein
MYGGISKITPYGAFGVVKDELKEKLPAVRALARANSSQSALEVENDEFKNVN